jgi:hypothetical protein
MKKFIILCLLMKLMNTPLSAQLYCLQATKVSQTATELVVAFTLSSPNSTALNVDASFVITGAGSISGEANLGGFGNIGAGQSFSVFNPGMNPAGTYTFPIAGPQPAGSNPALFLVDGAGELGVFLPGAVRLSLDPGCPINALVVLPLELTSFTATKSQNSAILTWKTASEKDLSYFNVQRSRDGVSFSNIGLVKALGNTVDPQKYTLTDDATLSGVGYYRLQAVDIDGKTQYSRVESLSFSKPLSAKAYPNPLESELNLEIDVDRRAGEVVVDIFDAIGKQFYQKKVQPAKDNTNFVVPTASLPAGSYLIRVTNGSDTWQQKITKI